MTKYTTKFFGVDRNASYKDACELIEDYLAEMDKQRWRLVGQSGGDKVVWLTMAREDSE